MGDKLKNYKVVAGEEIADCNDLPLNSVGYTYPETIHSPSAGTHILTYGLRDSYKVQIGISAIDYALHTRVCHNNVWSGWETYTRKSDLSYRAIVNYVSVQNNCVVNDAYIDNGVIVINGTIKAGTNGLVTLFALTDSRYFPRSEIIAGIAISASSDDEGRIHYVRIGNNGIATAWMSTLVDSERFSLVYPMRK